MIPCLKTNLQCLKRSLNSEKIIVIEGKDLKLCFIPSLNFHYQNESIFERINVVGRFSPGLPGPMS